MDAQLQQGSSSSGKQLIADRIRASDIPQDRLVLFHDRNGWCPYSERVWLAMMEKRLDFDEVLINLQSGKPAWYSDVVLINLQSGKPAWYSDVVGTSQTPAIRLSNGRVVYDSARILDFLDSEFPAHPLLPSDPALIRSAHELSAAFSKVFSKVMPSGARQA
ncbi:hypothetical protein T484DRAFT_1846312 [Baffinella frigidus]|nr:hypothetical protein T484DRAFT_1846312 [Cryptophyta sp. CCMP2293]